MSEHMEDLWHLIDDASTDGVQLIGPFAEHYRVVVNGYEVPYLTAYLIPGTEDEWNLVADRRFIMQASGDEVRRWLWFLANCMAVAAGWSAHGENSQPVNPYRVQVHEVDSAERSGK